LERLMGTHFFTGSKPKNIGAASPNLAARAFAAPGYAAKGDQALASKDLGAASAFQKGAFRGTTKDAASNAPGPKT
jgi:hypothetical protein